MSSLSTCLGLESPRKQPRVSVRAVAGKISGGGKPLDVGGTIPRLGSKTNSIKGRGGEKAS